MNRVNKAIDRWLDRHPTAGAVIFLIVGILCISSICVGVWATASYFEAKTYNRLTGSDVTTWEAMWVNLRVQEAPVRYRESEEG